MDDNKVSTSFEIKDGVTSVLQNMVKATNNAIKALDKMGHFLEELDETSLDKLENSIGDVDSKLDEATKSAKDTTSEVTSLNKSSLKQLDSGLNKVASSTQDIAKYTDRADQSMDSLARDDLSSLNSSLRKADQSLDEMASSANKADSKINSFSDNKIEQIESAAKDAKRAIGQIPPELDKVTSAADQAADSVNSIGDGIDTGGIGDALSSIGSSAKVGAFSSMLDIAEKVVDVVKQIAAASVEAASQMDSLRNSFTVGLGVSADEAAKYMSEAQETFAQGYGESLNDVASQMTYIKQTMGDLVEDSQLSDLTAEFSTLEQYGMDFNETVRGVKNLMVNFGIDSQNALDLMTVGMQHGLNASDELGDNIAEYSGRWAEAGVSASEYFSMLEAGMANGAYSLDKVGDYLNEFLTSMDDGRMEENIGSFSQQTQDLFQQWKSGGATEKQVFDSVISDLSSMTSETERATLASTLWSSLGEDNAMSMILALGGVSDSYADVDGAAQKATEANSSAVAELQNRWDLFKTNTLAPVGEVLAQMGIGLLDAVDAIGPFFDDCGKHISDFLTGAIANLEKFGTWLGEKVDWIKSMFSNIGSAITDGFWQGLSGIQQTLQPLIDKVTSWLPQSFKDRLGISSPSKVFQDEIGFNIVEGLKLGIQNAWSGLTAAANNLWTNFLSIFNGGQEEDNKQIVDYSGQIEQTKTQLAELQLQVQTGYDAILATVQEKNALIVQSGMTMFTTMTTAVTTDAQNMVTSINTIFSQIPLVVQTTLTTTLGVVQTSATQIPGIVQTTFEATLPVIQANFAIISAMASDQVAQLVARAQQALFEIMPAFSAVLDSLKTMMLSVLDSMNNSIIASTESFGSHYENIFSTTFDNVIALFGTFQTRAVGATNEMISAVDKTLDSQLPNVFNDAAVTSMNEFVAGIRSNISKATSVTSELVEQVKATFVKGLGIHSPSAVMYYYGTMTGQGYINGLSDSQLVEFAKGILLDMVNAFNGGHFNADDLVAYLDEDSLKVIDAYKKWPDIFEAAMPGVDMSIPGIVAAAREEIGYTASEGGSKFGAGAWCAWFVKAMAERAGVPFPNSGYVPNIKDWAVANNRWTQEPKSGYAVIFDWNGGDSGSHIGIVETVNPDGTITTIEGNTTGETSNSGVFRKKRSANIIGYVALDGGTGYGGQNGIVAAIQNAYNKIHGWGSLVIDPWASRTGNIPWDPSAGAEQWRGLVQTALQMLGQPLSYTDDILYAITCESGGDPNAINDWDSNKYGGNNSRGLMQTVPGTFQANALPGYNTNIWDPLSNILAGINYMINHYGSIENVMRDRRGHWRGYAVGTRYVPQDMLAMIHKGEAIIPASQNPYRDSGGDYLTEIAQKSIAEQPDLTMQNLAGEVIPMYSSGSNQDVTINLSFGDINNHGDLDNAKEEIIRFVDQELTVAIKRTGSVEHGY